MHGAHVMCMQELVCCNACAGLEEVVAAELTAPQIGASDVQPGKAGVHFR